MARKSPIRHNVRSHNRKKAPVNNYNRGKGSLPVNIGGSSKTVLNTRMAWFEKTERDTITGRGGQAVNIVDQQDGKINGIPVDVKAVRKDHRFRIDQDNHKYLLDHKGAYIFVNKDGEEIRLSAGKVDKLLKPGAWFKDRKYPHKFITVNQLFK